MTTDRSAQPDRRPSASPATPTRSCCARRARPTSRRRSAPSCASTTAAPAVPARIGRGRRAARPLLVPRRRPAPAARGPRRRGPDPDPPGDRATYAPDLPIDDAEAPDPLAAIRAFVPRRRVVPIEGMPRFTGGAVGALAYDAVSAFEPTVPLPERDPVGVPTGRLHRDRPRARVRPPDPHALGDRVAPHRGAGPRGPLPDRRGGDLRGARADGPPGRGRAGGARVGALDRRRTAPPRRRVGRSTRASAATSTSTPSRSRRTRSRPARRSRSSSPAASRSTCPTTRRRRADRRHRPLPRAASRQPQPVPVLRPHARRSRSSARARSCCSRSRATGSRPTRSPARGRAARRRARTTCSPSSSSATPRSGPST